MPVYTGDVSGVCAALYELGGMVVIHDPSGCNSTYNTHDEVRWNYKESLIFISGLNDEDAIKGNDFKFIDDICRAAESLNPKFIMIVNSPIPYINGTDFNYISKAVFRKTGIRTYYIGTNAMHDYTKGCSDAFLSIVEKILGPNSEKQFGIADEIFDLATNDYQELVTLEKNVTNKEDFPGSLTNNKQVENPSNRNNVSAENPSNRNNVSAENASNRNNVSAEVKSSDENLQGDTFSKISINLLGITPLDFPKEFKTNELRNYFTGKGFNVISSWSVNTSLEEISQFKKADVNVVLSSSGLAAAKKIEELYNIPYVVGVPIGEYGNYLCERIREVCKTRKSEISYLNKFNEITENNDDNLSKNIKNDNVYLVGEPVYMSSLKAAKILEGNNLESSYKTVCLTELHKGLLNDNDIVCTCEEELIEVIKDADYVVGDPLIKKLCKKDVTFTPIVHFALSGRTGEYMIENGLC